MTIALAKSSQRWVVVVGALLVLTTISPLIVEPVASQIRLTLMPDRERDESGGMVQILRNLQLSLADICYAQSTHYQHRGILYQIEDENILGEDIKEQRSQTEAAEGTTSTAAVSPKPATAPAAESHESEHDEKGHKHLTIIPSRNEDFRGIIGDVEREVKPFDITHVSHEQPSEALPWLRLATWINPTHENAWIATAFWLQGTQRKNPKAVSQAIALLEQARALNPPRPGQPYDKQGLNYMLGHLYLIGAGNPAKAIEILQPVVDRGESDFAQLNEVQRDWLSFSFRDAVQAYRKLGLHDKAIDLCHRGIRLFPDDRPLRSALRREQRLLEKK
jgi:tetratricopeptide (TPR) repeat protein